MSDVGFLILRYEFGDKYCPKTFRQYIADMEIYCQCRENYRRYDDILPIYCQNITDIISNIGNISIISVIYLLNADINIADSNIANIYSLAKYRSCQILTSDHQLLPPQVRNDAREKSCQ